MDNGMNNMMNGPEQVKPKKEKTPKTGAQKFLTGLCALLLVVCIAFMAILIIGNIMKNQGRVGKNASFFDGFMAMVNGTDEHANVNDDTSTGDKLVAKVTPSLEGVKPYDGDIKVPTVEIPTVNIPTINIPTPIISGNDENGDTNVDENGTDGNTEGTGNTDGAVDFAAAGSLVTKLGQYKNIEVEYKAQEVTEDEIDEELIYFVDGLAEYETVTKGKVALYDTVNFSCIGYVEGEMNDNCTVEEMDLTVGSGQMIPGFEDSMVGKKIGKSYSVDLTFPEDYYEEFAGKPVTFTITIHSKEVENIPELTDELIAANTDCSTIDEYREEIRKYIAQQHQEDAENEVRVNAIDKIIANCEFSEEIAQAVEAEYNYALDYYDQSFMQYYGADAATIYENYFGISADEYRQMVYEESERNVKYSHVVKAIVAAENLTYTQEEYDAAFEEVFFNQYGFGSKEEVFEVVSEEEAVPYVVDPLMNDKVEKIIFDSMVVSGR